MVWPSALAPMRGVAIKTRSHVLLLLLVLTRHGRKKHLSFSFFNPPLSTKWTKELYKGQTTPLNSGRYPLLSKHESGHSVLRETSKTLLPTLIGKTMTSPYQSEKEGTPNTLAWPSKGCSTKLTLKICHLTWELRLKPMRTI